MKEYSIEIVTNDTSCSEIEVEALHVEKLDHHNVIIDGCCMEYSRCGWYELC